MKHIHDLIAFKDKIKGKKVAVVNAQYLTVLKAVSEACKVGQIIPILIGDKTLIETIILENKIYMHPITIIDIKDDVLAAEMAVGLVKDKKADMLMKGLIDTKVILKAVLNKEKGIRDKKLLSHVTIFEFKHRQKVIFASDCAMNTTPTVEQKIEIIENALTVVRKLNIKEPKVALISAVEKENPNILSSVDAVDIKTYYENIKEKDFMIDGPFAIDNVVSKEAAAHKGIKSPVAGDADLFIFPNIDAGNVFYKTSVYLANALAIGIIIGAKAPIILTSRADSLESKLYSILLAGVYSDET